MRTLSLAVLSLALLAGCRCPFGNAHCPLGHKLGVQHPEMGSEKKAPAANLGTAPAQPWSATTVEAAVDKQPREGRVKTFTGEVIDVSCYLQLGKHGAKHKDCGQKCARNGNPLGLLAQDGQVYLLMAEEHHPRRDGKTDSLRDALIERMASVVTVTGTEARLDGTQALFVSGFAK